MGIGPIDVQNALVTDKIQDVTQRSADNRHASVTVEQQKDFDHKSKSVAETEKGENPTIDQNAKKEKEQEERKKKERQKELIKRLARDTGHIIDLEA